MSVLLYTSFLKKTIKHLATFGQDWLRLRRRQRVGQPYIVDVGFDEKTSLLMAWISLSYGCFGPTKNHKQYILTLSFDLWGILSKVGIVGWTLLKSWTLLVACFPSIWTRKCKPKKIKERFSTTSIWHKQVDLQVLRILIQMSYQSPRS